MGRSVHREHFQANTIQVSTLLSIKTGKCPEDCKYCSQSAHYDSKLEAEKRIAVEKVISEAKEAIDDKATEMKKAIDDKFSEVKRAVEDKASEVKKEVSEATDEEADKAA